MHILTKYLAKYLVLNFLVLEVFAADNSTNVTVAEGFGASGLVPDVIATAPLNLANVQFTSGASANLGKELTPTQVKNIPAVKWSASADLYYTLLLIDPDSPSPQWLHWLVVNIPGGSVSNGTTLAQYIGAGPGSNSGLHRYAFLVFSQPSIQTFNETKLNNTSTYKRTGFSIANFATKYNLTEAVAGNFFLAKYDDYVPILYKQIGISKAEAFKPTFVMLCIAVVLGYLR